MNGKKLLSTVISGVIFSTGLTTAISISFPKAALAQDFCSDQGMKVHVSGETRRYNVLICKSDDGLELYYLGGNFDGYTRIAAARYDSKLRGYKFGNDYYRGRVTRKEFVLYQVSQKDDGETTLIVNEKFRKYKQFR